MRFFLVNMYIYTFRKIPISLCYTSGRTFEKHQPVFYRPITPPINTQATSGDLADDNDFQSYFGYKLDNLPRMSVEFDPDDLSDGDPPVGKRHV